MTTRTLLTLSIATTLLAPAAARAEDDPGMLLMGAMMRTPAVSADGKHLAIYSVDPGGGDGARTSLAVFDAAGKLEQRIPLVPPAVDRARASAGAARITQLLRDGGYKRMGAMARGATKADGTTYATQLKHEELVVELRVAERKVELRATRDGKPLAPITRALPAGDGPCASVDAYTVANTTAGYDAKSGALAFSISAQRGAEVCFGHDFVVVLK
jgi:hypothetical protein